jgi:hypothetical protein
MEKQGFLEINGTWIDRDNVSVIKEDTFNNRDFCQVEVNGYTEPYTLKEPAAKIADHNFLKINSTWINRKHIALIIPDQGFSEHCKIELTTGISICMSVSAEEILSLLERN